VNRATQHPVSYCDQRATDRALRTVSSSEVSTGIRPALDVAADQRPTARVRGGSGTALYRFCRLPMMYRNLPKHEDTDMIETRFSGRITVAQWVPRYGPKLRPSTKSYLIAGHLL
jgi:hypothetical protein